MVDHTVTPQKLSTNAVRHVKMNEPRKTTGAEQRQTVEKRKKRRDEG